MSTFTEVNELSNQEIVIDGPAKIHIETETPKPFTARKVAIVGFAETSWKLAPWDDPTWEIWGLNGLHKVIKWNDRITRWFQIHSKNSVFGEGKGGGKEHVEFLKQLKIPVYMTRHYDEIPTSIAYPLKEICEWFSIGRDNERHPYLSNSISEMLALLAYEIIMGEREVDEVGVWGVDMSHCIAPETKVLTTDLIWVQAKDIEKGQELIGFDEESTEENRGGQNRRYRKCVVDNITRIILPCYRLTMEDGSIIVCSSQHKWLCSSAHRNHWMTTEELIPKGAFKDSRSSHILKPLETWEYDNSREAGYLAGAFDGEGNISQKPNNFNGTHLSLGFAQNENDMGKYVEQILTAKSYEFNKISEKTGKTNKYTIKGGKCEVLKFLGKIRPPRLLNKFNPDAIGAMRTRNHVAVIKKEFLGEQEVIGWKTSTRTFIAEGFASHNSTEYGYQKSSCEFYLGIFEGYRQIMAAFKKFGILTGIMDNGQFKSFNPPFPSKWTLPKESLLLESKYIYGYEDEEEEADRARLIARKSILAQQRNAHLAKEQESHDAQMQFLGAVQENENEMKNRGY